MEVDNISVKRLELIPSVQHYCGFCPWYPLHNCPLPAILGHLIIRLQSPGDGFSIFHSVQYISIINANGD